MTVAERQERLKALKTAMLPKHLLVCHATLSGSTYQAAWKAQYPKVKKDITASDGCSKALKSPTTGMGEYIEHMKWFAGASAAEKLGIDQHYILSGLKTVAERCMVAIPVMEKVDGDWVETGEWKFEHHGANRSLELMGKEIGMFKEKVAIETADPLTEILQKIGERNSTRSPLPSGL